MKEWPLAEQQRYGLELKPDIQRQTHGATDYRLLLVVASDGVCYCIGKADK